MSTVSVWLWRLNAYAQVQGDQVCDDDYTHSCTRSLNCNWRLASFSSINKKEICRRRRGAAAVFSLTNKTNKTFSVAWKELFLFYFFYLVIYVTKETPIFAEWHCAIPLYILRYDDELSCMYGEERRRAVRRRDGSLLKRGAWTDQQAPREEIDLKQHFVCESSMRIVLKLLERFLNLNSNLQNWISWHYWPCCRSLAIIITRIAVTIKCDNHLSEVKDSPLNRMTASLHCWFLFRVFQRGKRTWVRHGFLLFKTVYS